MCTVNNLNHIMNDVINDAISVGFPVSIHLDRHIHIDKNTYDRVGACYRYRFPERYEIHLSEATLRARCTEIKNIIAHEVLHTHFLTMEHNLMWQMYCDLMKDKFGYNIQVKYSWHNILNNRKGV